MASDFEIRQIFPSVPSQMSEAEQLLLSAGLRPEVLPYFVGAYDAGGTLAGVGGLDADVIKCVAVAPEARGTSVTNLLVSHLMARAQQEGFSNVFVFTKPEYAPLFSSLSFHVIGRAANAVLLESDPRGIRRYSAYLQKLERGKRNGVIVMNCNPMTLGHLHLISSAAAQLDRLFIIPVMEDKSLFCHAERRQMLLKACEGMGNVTVCEGSKYSISAATFPTYFLKELSSAAQTQIELDCDIFSRHIIPALGVSVRFVGTEPEDALTLQYNSLMASLLPIEVKSVERLCHEGVPICASSVRKAIAAGRTADALALVPMASVPYVLAESAAWALTSELELTPKPGLVDLHDNGAHSDMSPQLMRRSIAALRPWLARLAATALDAGLSPDALALDLQREGILAEKAMFETTGGINTHKGALFCMGITLCAAVRCLCCDSAISPVRLRAEIMGIAAHFPQTRSTNGAMVRAKYGVGGALEAARSGYAMLFDVWLPFLRKHMGDPNASILLLLKIMSTIDDTNVYHRRGAEAAERVKAEAAALLEDFSVEALRRMNGSFVAQNISPGGAADMLALTLFVNSIIQQ